MLTSAGPEAGQMAKECKVWVTYDVGCVIEATLLGVLVHQ